MRIHHLNCTTMCPIGGRLMDGRSRGRLRGELVCHCLLIETDAGLVLVDTGFGLRDVAQPHQRLSAFFRAQLQPELRAETTAGRQVQALGFHPEDVRHILLTHLDFDHAGGLDDFPAATVHLLELEASAAAGRETLLDRWRFRPQQWSSRARWHTYKASSGEPWFGFQCVRRLAGLPPEILMVPLVGHTLGHAGIAVHRPEGWLLHAGDAYFYHAEMQAEPSCTPGLRLYQRLMEKNRGARLHNQERLRYLRHHHGQEVEIFCAHDVREYATMVARSRAAALQAQPCVEDDDSIDSQGFTDSPASDVRPTLQ